MENRKNNRQIPTGEGFMANQKIFDLLYVKLQTVSSHTQGENHRYLKKSLVNVSQWSKELKVSRPTFGTKMKKLIEDGYVVEKEINGEAYYLLPKADGYYSLIPEITLTYLLDTANEDVIKVYCLLECFWRTYGKDAYFTKDKLLKSIGYKCGANNKTKLYQKINNILNCLSYAGMISFEERYEVVEGITLPKQYLTDFNYYDKANQPGK